MVLKPAQTQRASLFKSELHSPTDVGRDRVWEGAFFMGALVPALPSLPSIR